MIIAVLGGGIDLHGKVPQHVINRLDESITILNRHPAAVIAVSGKYSFFYGERKPILTEAMAMAAYLFSKGVAKDKVIIEQNAQDTISNAYYLKKNVFIPNNERTGTIITSQFHLQRTIYIFDKVFGSEYNLTYVGVEDTENIKKQAEIIKHQDQVLQKTKNWLEQMPDGDHTFLNNAFFDAPYYKEERQDWIKNFVAEGKI